MVSPQYFTDKRYYRAPMSPEAEAGRHVMYFGTDPNHADFKLREVELALAHEMGHVFGLQHEHQVGYGSNKTNLIY
jgi:hypothetical protein